MGSKSQIFQDLFSYFFSDCKKKGTFIEIGGGNGFFLEAALNEGAIKVTGVEPSDKAINSASTKVRPYLIKSMMKPDLIPKDSIDIVTAFHVLDHLVDPLEVVKMSVEVLAAKGFFVAVVHNERSISSKIFKNRSPIFDVEHTFLFSKLTGIKLLELAGLRNVNCKSYANHATGRLTRQRQSSDTPAHFNFSHPWKMSSSSAPVAPATPQRSTPHAPTSAPCSFPAPNRADN